MEMPRPREIDSTIANNGKAHRGALGEKLGMERCDQETSKSAPEIRMLDRKEGPIARRACPRPTRTMRTTDKRLPLLVSTAP